jgi:2-C-methyl-D-erythritol 4-phosphate cytidylyltransferase
MMGSVWTVVVAAGSGMRFGGAKQYAELAGRPVLSWAVSAAHQASEGVVLVVPAGDERHRCVVGAGADVVVVGGPTRSGSVRAGLAAVPDHADIIVIHDAARPLAGPALFMAAIAAIRDGADGAICAVAMADTVKRVTGDQVVHTVDRADLVAVQTPQAFAAGALRAAHASGAEATDDGALVEAFGGSVVTVPGDAANRKLTSPVDLVIAEVLLGGDGRVGALRSPVSISDPDSR